MSLIDRPARWCAARPLVAAVLFSAAITVPTAYGLERRTEANAEKVEEVATSTTTSTTEPGSPPMTRPAVTDEQIIRIIVEFCRENDCAPLLVDEPETQESEQQDAEVQEGERQDPEIQDPELQEPEIQEAPIPGPAGPAGPACPTGYTLREVRIPSVSNQTIFLVCARG